MDRRRHIHTRHNSLPADCTGRTPRNRGCSTGCTQSRTADCTPAVRHSSSTRHSPGTPDIDMGHSPGSPSCNRHRMDRTGHSSRRPDRRGRPTHTRNRTPTRSRTGRRFHSRMGPPIRSRRDRPTHNRRDRPHHSYTDRSSGTTDRTRHSLDHRGCTDPRSQRRAPRTGTANNTQAHAAV